MNRPRRRRGDQDGFLATPVLLVLWVGLLLGIVVVDIGAYVVAAARAQGAADAAALAAVGLDVDPVPAPPEQIARSIASRNDARIERCACRTGSGRAEVEVSASVPGLFVPRVVGAQRVTATADAELADGGDPYPAPFDPAGPGPSPGPPSAPPVGPSPPPTTDPPPPFVRGAGPDPAAPDRDGPAVPWP